MATSPPPPVSRPPRRPVSIAGAPNTPASRPKPTPSSAISKGATARAAVSPRPGPPSNGRRTPNTTASSPRSSPVPGEESQSARDALISSLKRETEQREELLVRLQEKENQVNEALKENSSISTALNAAESRLSEFYAEQARMEEEMAARMEINEKLRAQVRELEKDKREALRRYAEQTASFEAERQALYDNEQHLKSRIQSLTASRKLQQEAIEQAKEELAERSSSTSPEEDHRDMLFPSPRPPRPAPKEDDPDVSDGPEITALKLELSTLTTSHTSIQTTVQILQAELTELKRVNNALQEENESYSLLLMERALNGSGVDMLRRVGGQDEATSSHTESLNIAEDRNLPEEIERSSLRSSKKSNLDRVIEDDEYTFDTHNNGDIPASLAAELQTQKEDVSAPLLNQRRRRTRASSTSLSHPGTPVGESLADLPITGPGLDLAAELGRAENKDILDGGGTTSLSNSGQKFSDSPMMVKESSGEVEALRQEVRSLKDANKALSLYASKIIDRIIMQEGFEHVLSVDYDNKSSGLQSPGAFEGAAATTKETPARSTAPKIPGFFSSLSSSATPKAPAPSTNKEGLTEFPKTEKAEKLTTFDARPVIPVPSNADKRNRRSMSFDWRSFSMFGGASSSAPEKEKNLRPLTLRPGAPTLTVARKLESEEDDDDKKERERLNATMKLMGIKKPPEEARTISAPVSEAPSSKSSSSNRFSFFGLMSKPAQTLVEPPTPSSELTSEALERAEAETSLASLDAREKALSAEIAKGHGSGFTELQIEGRLSLGDQWRSQRSRSASGKSHSSGASTVWSAGLRGEEE